APRVAAARTSHCLLNTQSSFPRKRRAVRGKKCGCKSAADDSLSPSWPGLSRPSTSFLGVLKDVDARHKAGHDDCKVYHSSCGLVGRAVRNFPRTALRLRGNDGE